MIRAMWVCAVIAVSACGNSTAAPQGESDRIAMLEERIRALERLVAKVGRDEASRRDDDAAFAGRLDEVLWQTRYLRARGETESRVLRRLDRIEGLLSTRTGRVRGWWCVGHTCGRTRVECQLLAERSLTSDFKRIDGALCSPVAKVWCSDSDAFECEPFPCDKCKPFD